MSNEQRSDAPHATISEGSPELFDISLDHESTAGCSPLKSKQDGTRQQYLPAFNEGAVLTRILSTPSPVKLLSGMAGTDARSRAEADMSVVCDEGYVEQPAVGKTGAAQSRSPGSVGNASTPLTPDSSEGLHNLEHGASSSSSGPSERRGARRAPRMNPGSKAADCPEMSTDVLMIPKLVLPFVEEKTITAPPCSPEDPSRTLHCIDSLASCEILAREKLQLLSPVREPESEDALARECLLPLAPAIYPSPPLSPQRSQSTDVDFPACEAFAREFLLPLEPMESLFGSKGSAGAVCFGSRACAEVIGLEKENSHLMSSSACSFKVPPECEDLATARPGQSVMLLTPASMLTERPDAQSERVSAQKSFLPVQPEDTNTSSGSDCTPMRLDTILRELTPACAVYEREHGLEPPVNAIPIVTPRGMPTTRANDCASDSGEEELQTADLAISSGKCGQTKKHPEIQDASLCHCCDKMAVCNSPGQREGHCACGAAMSLCGKLRQVLHDQCAGSPLAQNTFEASEPPAQEIMTDGLDSGYNREVSDVIDLGPVLNAASDSRNDQLKVQDSGLAAAAEEGSVPPVAIPASRESTLRDAATQYELQTPEPTRPEEPPNLRKERLVDIESMQRAMHVAEDVAAGIITVDVDNACILNVATEMSRRVEAAESERYMHVADDKPAPDAVPVSRHPDRRPLGELTAEVRNAFDQLNRRRFRRCSGIPFDHQVTSPYREPLSMQTPEAARFAGGYAPQARASRRRDRQSKDKELEENDKEQIPPTNQCSPCVKENKIVSDFATPSKWMRL